MFLFCFYYIGLAERRCNSDRTWGEVDVTACTSQEFNNIILEVHVQLYQFSKQNQLVVYMYILNKCIYIYVLYLYLSI